MNAMRSFASAARFPKSVCNALIDGLDSHLVPIFRRNYPDHAVLHDLSASYQRGKFQDILRAMQMAEDEVNSISEIACSTVNGQAFHADALVHASQAERTLSRYHGGDGYTSEEGTSGGYRSDGGRSGTPTGFHREGDSRPAGPPIANHADGVLQQPTVSGKTTTPQQELYSSESKAAVFKNPDNEHRPSRVAKRLDT